MYNLKEIYVYFFKKLFPLFVLVSFLFTTNMWSASASPSSCERRAGIIMTASGNVYSYNISFFYIVFTVVLFKPLTKGITDSQPFGIKVAGS